MYAAWNSGTTVKSKEDVPLWQIAVIALTICVGFITYGYVSRNLMMTWLQMLTTVLRTS
jgi:phosphate/sulfate permease